MANGTTTPSPGMTTEQAERIAVALETIAWSLSHHDKDASVRDSALPRSLINALASIADHR